MKTKRFAGKVVLITGAASGFGRLAAERFAAEGALLVLGDINAAGLKETVALVRKQRAKVIAKRTDVTKEAAVKALVDAGVAKFGRLDIALNNAGIAHASKKLADTDGALMRLMFDVNVMGVFHGMKAQIPVMEKQGGGIILNTASVAGVLGAPLLGAYGASKHAVIGLTKTAAAENAKRNIRVNAICPAFAETPMLTGSLDSMHGPRDEALNRLVQTVPMRRAGTAAEIVEGMLFLCSAENSFMTGHALVVDGGLSAI